jgi:hypothetical protein
MLGTNLFPFGWNLRRAVAKGYKDAQHMTQDKGLDRLPWHGRPKTACQTGPGADRRAQELTRRRACRPGFMVLPIEPGMIRCQK